MATLAYFPVSLPYFNQIIGGWSYQ